MKAGEMLDGEGGNTICGKFYSAKTFLKLGGLLIGLAHQVTLLRDILAGTPVCRANVNAHESIQAV